MPTHSAHNVVRKKGFTTRRTRLLIINSQKRTSTGDLTTSEVRFPAGTNFDHPAERLCDTMRRKVLQETGLEVKSCGKLLASRVENDHHTKNAVLVEDRDCVGELRQEPIEVRGKKLSPPYFMRIGEVRRRIADDHRWVMEALDREIYGGKR